MGVKSIMKRLIRPLLTLVDRVYADDCICSIGDIILKRGVMNTNQFLLTTRMMDVEHYINGDTSFIYQTTISRKAYGDHYTETMANESFARLIESYKVNGYDSKFPVTVDSHINLCDGNHRIGCNLFFKISKVKVHRLRYHLKGLDTTDVYWRKYKLPSTFIEEVYLKYNQIQDWLVETGNTFVAIAPHKIGEYDFKKDMEHLVNVLKFRELKDGRVMCQFWLNDPDYKYQNKDIISVAVLNIKEALITRYGSENIIVSLNCLSGLCIYNEYVKNSKYHCIK